MTDSEVRALGAPTIIFMTFNNPDSPTLSEKSDPKSNKIFPIIRAVPSEDKLPI